VAIWVRPKLHYNSAKSAVGSTAAWPSGLGSRKESSDSPRLGSVCESHIALQIDENGVRKEACAAVWVGPTLRCTLSKMGVEVRAAWSFGLGSGRE